MNDICDPMAASRVEALAYLLGEVGETSLLRSLQAQTLPDEAPAIGKIHRFSKMAVTFEPLMRF